MATSKPKTILHLGAGDQHVNPDEFPSDEWREVRIDLEDSQHPEIVADVRDLSMLDDGCADAIYVSHVLEHIPETELLQTLKEWRRLLVVGGELIVLVPDIQEAARWIADGRGCDPMYYTNTLAMDGLCPIRPLDLIYGAASAAAAHPLMRHATGFTASSLTWWLSAAGFQGQITRAGDPWGLEARVRKNGSPPLIACDPDKVLILVSRGGDVQDDQPEAPPEPEEKPEGFTEVSQVSEHVAVSIIDPDDDA